MVCVLHATILGGGVSKSSKTVQGLCNYENDQKILLTHSWPRPISSYIFLFLSPSIFFHVISHVHLNINLVLSKLRHIQVLIKKPKNRPLLRVTPQIHRFVKNSNIYHNFWSSPILELYNGQHPKLNIRRKSRLSEKSLLMFNTQ